MTEELQLHLLTLVARDSREIYYCKTVAHSVDEALEQCSAHYGPVELNARGTFRLDPGRGIRGGGEFIPSPYDHLLTPDQRKAFSS